MGVAGRKSEMILLWHIALVIMIAGFPLGILAKKSTLGLKKNKMSKRVLQLIFWTGENAFQQGI